MSAGRLDCGKHLNVRGHSDAHRNKYSQLVPQLPSNIQHRDQAQQSQGGRVVSTNPAIPVRWESRPSNELWSRLSSGVVDPDVPLS